MTCSLGDSLEGIVKAVRHQRLKVEQLPFTLSGLPYTRPYYLIRRNEEDRLENRSEAYFYEVLFSTVSRALADAGVSDAEIREMPLFFGSTSMDVPVFEGKHSMRSSSVSELFLQASNGYGKIAGAVMDRFGMEGNTYSFITACTSSANAVLYAASMIEERCIERALVVGYDLYNNLGFYGFEGLKSLAASEYRPFDRARDGLILGEACGAMVLEGQNRKDSDFICLHERPLHRFRYGGTLFIVAGYAVGITEVCPAKADEIGVLPLLPLQNHRAAGLAEDQAVPRPVKGPVIGRGDGFEALKAVNRGCCTGHSPPLGPYRCTVPRSWMRRKGRHWRSMCLP